MNISKKALLAALAATTLTLSASAAIDVRMPRTEDGIVTDGDGIIDSDGIASDMPEMSDLLPDGSGGEGSDALDPADSGTATVTTAEETTEKVTESVTARETTGVIEDAADGMGIRPWVVVLILIAVVSVVIALVVWWLSDKNGRDR